VDCRAILKPASHPPEAGHGVQVLGGVGVDDGRAADLRDHERLRLELPVRDDRVEHLLEVLPDDAGATVDGRAAAWVVVMGSLLGG